jgi:hypothetical protein
VEIGKAAPLDPACERRQLFSHGLETDSVEGRFLLFHRVVFACVIARRPRHSWLS